MAFEDEVATGAASAFKKVVNGVTKTIKFLRTGVGLIVLKLIAIVLLLFGIYVLSEAVFQDVGAILFKNNTGMGTDEYDRSPEFLQNLNNSGYDSLVNADQLMRYYSFEYAVLMDEAEYIETHGVYLLEKQNEGVIDWQKITKEQWNQLAAKAMNYEDHKFREGDFGTQKPEEHIPGNHDEKMELAQDTLYYRPLVNEYTQKKSLIPIFRATRRDTYLRYFMTFNEFSSELNRTDKEIVYANNTWNAATEFGKTADDSLENAQKQYSMSAVGSITNTILNKFENWLDILITATLNRYEIEGGYDPSGAPLAKAA